MYNTILSETRDAVSLITLNRPDALETSLSEGMAAFSEKRKARFKHK